MAYQSFAGYLTPNPFLTNNKFYFKHFNLVWVQFNCQKTFLFQAIQFSQTVLIQTIQFSIITQFKYQNSSISSNLV